VNILDIAQVQSVVPVLTIHELDNAVPIARALVAGGLRVLEITLRTAVALDALAAIRQSVPEAIVGAGTLTRAADFAAAGRARAHFGVTPGMTRELEAAVRGARFPVLPGVMTPSEVITARQAGFEVMKLFPAVQAGGVELLRALAGPFPETLFCPTGGITRANAAEFLALPNVTCVGGSWFTPPDAVRASDWRTIEALAREAAALK
jgi:2-dehydro-3-deoxyphosphogluconate aldolase / (4S)-4-hydroxy-2-oxoglutarate aldolase